MQQAEKNNDSATESGGKGDNDVEVVSTKCSDRAEHPDDCRETVPTNNKIEKIVEVHHCKVGTEDIDTDKLKFFHAVLIKVADKLARQAGERNDTRSRGEFRRDDAVREGRYREGT